jgi:hypothetical protein
MAFWNGKRGYEESEKVSLNVNKGKIKDVGTRFNWACIGHNFNLNYIYRSNTIK